MPSERTAIRQCLGCRDRTDRGSLIRLVASPDGQLVVDLKGRLPGRGAWVHPRPECVAAVVSRPGLLHRTLRQRVDASRLAEQLQEAVQNALFHGLSLAAAGGGLVVGFDRLSFAIVEGRVQDVLVAKDASPRTVQALTRVLESNGSDQVPLPIPWTREAIGTQIGQGACAVLGVVAMPATDYLRAQLQRFRDLG
ncbi:MAG: DUF448 domain-containing protein [Myxococcota bacterium]